MGHAYLHALPRHGSCDWLPRWLTNTAKPLLPTTGAGSMSLPEPHKQRQGAGVTVRINFP